MAEPSNVRLALLRTAPLEGCSQNGAPVSGQMLWFHCPAQCSHVPPKCRQPLRAVTHLAEASRTGGPESCQQRGSGAVAGEAHCAGLGTADEPSAAVTSYVADASVERGQVGLHSVADLQQGCAQSAGQQTAKCHSKHGAAARQMGTSPAPSVQGGLVTHRYALPDA